MTFEIENLKCGAVKNNYPQIEKEFEIKCVLNLVGRLNTYVEINTLEELIKLSEIVGKSLIIEKYDNINNIVIFDDYL